MSMPMPGGRGKSKIVAGVLAILLPGFGIHHFYLGSTVAGLIELVAICCFGVGSIISIIEGILLLVMPDPEFDARYNARTPEPMEFVFLPPKA